ncbi:MAG: cbb3-type cytochrome oxidase assembly protein CcoS [Acidobacteria bacterium]|nr:cbb3-type cytochrome oxidase assembly protein CcoS [Acidobacteriota bacterium]
METIFVLLPLALLIAAIAVGSFVWAAKTGQFDDLDTPAVRMLFDDPPSPRPQDRAGRGYGAASASEANPNPERRVSE